MGDWYVVPKPVNTPVKERDHWKRQPAFVVPSGTTDSYLVGSSAISHLAKEAAVSSLRHSNSRATAAWTKNVARAKDDAREKDGHQARCWFALLVYHTDRLKITGRTSAVNVITCPRGRY